MVLFSTERRKQPDAPGPDLQGPGPLTLTAFLITGPRLAMNLSLGELRTKALVPL